MPFNTADAQATELKKAYPVRNALHCFTALTGAITGAQMAASNLVAYTETGVPGGSTVNTANFSAVDDCTGFDAPFPTSVTPENRTVTLNYHPERYSSHRLLANRRLGQRVRGWHFLPPPVYTLALYDSSLWGGRGVPGPLNAETGLQVQSTLIGGSFDEYYGILLKVNVTGQTAGELARVDVSEHPNSTIDPSGTPFTFGTLPTLTVASGAITGIAGTPTGWTELTTNHYVRALLWNPTADGTVSGQRICGAYAFSDAIKVATSGTIPAFGTTLLANAADVSEFLLQDRTAQGEEVYLILYFGSKDSLGG